MKIAIILCQRSLNSDMIIALQTAPGHSFKNPAERVNCISNLGLHGMGVMHKNIPITRIHKNIANVTIY